MHRPQPLYIITAIFGFLVIAIGFWQLAKTGLVSADVIAAEQARRPFINIADFEPGEPEFVLINGLQIIVWRRDDADKERAALYNNPDAWRHQHSKVLGQSETVFADDANITLDHEWFFGIAEFRNPYSYIILESGDFDGFFEGRYARHYDLSGRIRKGFTADNLTIVPAAYAADGQRIQLFLNGIP